MSLTTRCPVCETRFKLAPRTLRNSGGWARCGNCDNAFDAARHLERKTDDTDFEDWDMPAPSTQLDLGVISSLPELELADGASSRKRTPMTDQMTSSATSSYGGRGDVGDNKVIATPILRPAVSDDIDSAPGSAASGGAETGASNGGKKSVDVRSRDREVRKNLKGVTQPAPRTAPKPEPADDSNVELTFLRDQPSGDPASRSRRSRWPAFLVVLLLAATLAIQVALQNRDRLAARAPALAPLLRQACGLVGCEVGSVRQIDALVIDNSSLNKAGAGYRLHLAIRNQSDIELEMPGIELTLTDTRDQAVVRRVLLPAELGAAATIAAGGEWSGAIAVSIASDVQRIAGYRVLAFYP